MGVDIHALHLLHHAYQKYGPLGRTITLGRQAVILGPRAMRKWLGSTDGSYCEPLLKQHFGATEVDSADNSPYEGATIIADLNKPVSPELHGAYDTVIDFGTTEHVFDVRQALENVSRICRPGGAILHVVPTNGFCGHGFYQFSPELYFSLYSEDNGYKDTEIYVASLTDCKHWYRVSAPSDGRRINLQSINEVYVIVITQKVLSTNTATQQSDYVFQWASGKNKISLPYRPGRMMRLIERFSRSVILSNILAYINNRLSESGMKSLNRHPNLMKINISDLVSSVDP
ncbi:MAG TPA: class I SAM-dependent methyltransferase [Ottowia sp.]|uniref:class I SAM-dependent methyltransferase n=1 Tax=Ottowia sp. TaxID=1898956 RepID=UPI002C248848|nr:class I SAM-dependent methyltransferase [Ottowia sp.]HMN19842.1 class I SAM-dependent methyltransferase [Ottowia sp.]